MAKQLPKDPVSPRRPVILAPDVPIFVRASQ